MNFNIDIGYVNISNHFFIIYQIIIVINILRANKIGRIFDFIEKKESMNLSFYYIYKTLNYLIY